LSHLPLCGANLYPKPLASALVTLGSVAQLVHAAGFNGDDLANDVRRLDKAFAHAHREQTIPRHSKNGALNVINNLNSEKIRASHPKSPKKTNLKRQQQAKLLTKVPRSKLDEAKIPTALSPKRASVMLSTDRVSSGRHRLELADGELSHILAFRRTPNGETTSGLSLPLSPVHLICDVTGRIADEIIRGVCAELTSDHLVAHLINLELRE
jgi:hypothetical protein